MTVSAIVEMERLGEPVGVDSVALPPIGQGPDRRPHRRLGAREQFVGKFPDIGSEYSSSVTASRFSINSTAPASAQMSPIVWSGVRTLVRSNLSRVASGTPSRMNRISGM